MNGEAVTRFADVAEAYVHWTDSPPGEPREEMATAQRLLSELQYWIVRLPDSGWQDARPAKGEHIVMSSQGEATLEEHQRRYSLAAERFNGLPVNTYWLVSDPLDKEDLEPVCGTLSDDLADVYCDLLKGLEEFRRGNFDEAVLQWRFNFDVHWGQHLLEAQRVIHSYLQG